MFFTLTDINFKMILNLQFLLLDHTIFANLSIFYINKTFLNALIYEGNQ